MALDRKNTNELYVTGRMIAITEHYAGDKFGPNTLSRMFSHPVRGFDVFSQYIDKSDEYYTELQDVQFPASVKSENDKGRMWIGYYHQKSAYNSTFVKKDIRGRILDRLQEKGMTQRGLAERMGITPQELNGFLRGRQAISLTKLERIIDILDL